MLTATDGLAQLRPHYSHETRELFNVFLNATSHGEANLALEVLRTTVPEKALVTACNLREVVRSLPSSPFSMRVDEPILTRTAGLTKNIAARSKTLSDGIELSVTTAGNLVLDVIFKTGDRKYYLSPMPVQHEYVSTRALELIIKSDVLLDELIDLVKCMGLVFNPKFYLSLEDYLLEYAAETIHDLDELF